MVSSKNFLLFEIGNMRNWECGGKRHPKKTRALLRELSAYFRFRKKKIVTVD